MFTASSRRCRRQPRFRVIRSIENKNISGEESFGPGEEGDRRRSKFVTGVVRRELAICRDGHVDDDDDDQEQAELGHWVWCRRR